MEDQTDENQTWDRRTDQRQTRGMFCIHLSIHLSMFFIHLSIAMAVRLERDAQQQIMSKTVGIKHSNIWSNKGDCG